MGVLLVKPDVDLIIIGAGLSGIGAACHFSINFPEKKYLILESRDNLGGTWDFFKYPGIRSDSDMHTLGYNFKPWKEKKAIADGSDIFKYIDSTAAEFQVKENIRYNSKVSSANWETENKVWTVNFTDSFEKQHRLRSRFVYSCSGYYSYDEAHMPEFPNIDAFKGRVVHPQFWPSKLDYDNKKITVIGSGATAVTLVPSLTEKASHVTMLQRSPTYIVSRPAVDKTAKALEKYLPEKTAYKITRWKNIFASLIFYHINRAWPIFMKQKLIDWVRRSMRDAVDVDTHFTPTYKPWDQRVCMVPNGDLFKCLRNGSASIITDQIEEFTAEGIKVKSGEHIDADIVITATGLKMLPLGGIDMRVDGQKIDISSTVQYKGVMLSSIPNFFVASGYTNASWTLKCDLTSKYVCRLIKYCDSKGYQVCMPRDVGDSEKQVMSVGLTSGYILRSINKFPKEGLRSPWKLRQNYFLDLIGLRFAALKNNQMFFS